MESSSSPFELPTSIHEPNLGSVYTNLPVSARLIRLLQLKPAEQWSSPLDGSLHVVSLEDKPAYKALSYVWDRKSERESDTEDDLEGVNSRLGNDSTSQIITVNDHSIRISRNLYSALKRIRGKSESIAIWVDVICINQADVEERNHQVRMMGTIYSEAREVCVCFDDDEEVNEYFDNVCPSIIRDATYWRTWKSKPLGSQGPLREPTFDELVIDLIDTSWWKRVWTAQEFLLGKNVMFFFFSDDSLTIDDLMDWIDFMEEYAIRQEWNSSAPTKTQTHSDRVQKRSLGQFHYSNVSLELFWTRHIKQLILLRQIINQNPKKITALDLVSFSRYRDAGEVKDKIFAFLGLFPDMLHLVDYRLSVEVCFERFAATCIESLQNLDIFNHIIGYKALNLGNQQHSAGIRRGFPTHLPSWVPDWTLKLGHSESMAIRRRTEQLKFNKASSNQPEVTYLGDGKLLVRGSHCSTVAEVGKQYWSRHHDEAFDSGTVDGSPTACIRDWLNIATKFSDAGSIGELQDSFLRCLSRDFSYEWMEYFNNQRSEPPLENEVAKLDTDLRMIFLNYFTKPDIDDDSIDTACEREMLAKLDVFADFVLDSAFMERFFIDDYGRFGFAPATALSEDIVVVLDGGKCPYVLRKADDKSQTASGLDYAEAELYTILGPAYIDGLMNGEAPSINCKNFLLV